MTTPLQPMTPKRNDSEVYFTISSFATQIASGKKNWLDGLSLTELMRALSEWKFSARRDQFHPDNDWTTWLILGGRGAGKTRAGAEWIRRAVANGARRLALVGETYEDAREVMIDGQSGLLHIGDAPSRPTYEPSRHRLSWPNGAEAHIFSADDPDGLRGHQFEAAWADELCKWRYPEEAWSNLQLGLRLGQRPQQVVTTTPRPIKLLRQLMDAETTHLSRATTRDNKAELADAFLTEIIRTYEGTALGRQEIDGEIIEDHGGALWNRAMIERARIKDTPPLSRIIVAVDPPVSTGPDADECGIIVAGITGEGRAATAFILKDASVGGLSPSGWAARVVEIAYSYAADRVVAEVNQGGDLVEEVLRLHDPNLPFRAVRATRGKTVRAEPVAALYEQGRVKHAGAFPDLEDQLTSFTGLGGEASPDRLDALVWAVTDLLLGPAPSAPAIRYL